MHLTTVVGGKPMLVDYKTINKALNFPQKHSTLPCIDIYSLFVFNKPEFELYVSFFCDEDIPIGLCDSNCGIHYKHFTPVYQLIALILRSNIIPKPNQDKFFDFFDLKIMFLIVTNKIDFSLSYVILLNMINAHLADYMPYGMLLTSMFNIYHISMPLPIATESASHINIAHVRTQIPLTKCEPQEARHVRTPYIMQEETSL